MNECPCGSGKSFDACCGPIIGGTPAVTAEALMRSRYSAYVKRSYEHLEQTLSSDQRGDFSRDDAKRWAESAEWLGLSIIKTEKGGPDDQQGIVQFSARYRMEGQEKEHLETALFGREEGKWVYSGQIVPKGETFRREAPKVGRNDPCPCGSGKKYKKCCGVTA